MKKEDAIKVGYRYYCLKCRKLYTYIPRGIGTVLYEGSKRCENCRGEMFGSLKDDRYADNFLED
jgi:predicted SprT family Zn-dependent metalloprotease